MVCITAIDVHIGRLREKLGDDPAEPRFIQTIRGIGSRAIGDLCAGAARRRSGSPLRIYAESSAVLAWLLGEAVGNVARLHLRDAESALRWS
jgi:DNA-binding winged helix-turn-helix (wHTH) protein